MFQQTTTQAMLSLISLSLFHTATALPQNNGMWSPSVAVASETAVASAAVESTWAPEVTSAPVVAATSVSDWTTAVTWPAGCESWANPCPAGALTSGIAPTVASAAAYTPAVVTWPAGCETWANPCPATAVVSGGGSVLASAPTAVAWSSASDYSNAFTIYTTQTNSNGVITGMPSKATVAGGASSVLSEQSVAMSGWATSTVESAAVTSAAVSSEATGFNLASPSSTTSAAFVESTGYTGAGVVDRGVKGAAAVVGGGLAVLMLV